MSNIQLRTYQQEAVNSIFQYFTQNVGNPLIALPTGTGKTYVIAAFIQMVLGLWPRQRFIILSHVKEIIEQDIKALYRLWPTAPIGIYSASLSQKDVMMPIIFGGVASVVKNISAFGHRDLLIIDEAHLLSPKDDTMYQRIISELKLINPAMKVIGLTATPFRLGQGMLTDGGLFTDVCYDLTEMLAFNKLVQEGFISPLVSQKTNSELDISNVGMNNGDFAKGELEKAVDKKEVTYAALKETVEQAYNRKHWLIFASGIEHAEHIAEMLPAFGIKAAAVHSKISKEERDKRIAAFKRGELRAISNNNVLTTGFDFPAIDCIPMLRPTVSPGLWVQMLGRGTRPSPESGKVNCLVMDFAGNTRRLGPINDPLIPKKKGKETGEVPIKVCEQCGCYNHLSARFCDNCGYEFPRHTKITRTASNEDVLRSDGPIVEYYEVNHVTYRKHVKTGKPPSMKVDYYSGLMRFSEWVCLEHSGFAKKNAHDWWRQRHTTEPPDSTDQALAMTGELRQPKRIRVWTNKALPEVLGYEF